MYHIFFIHLSVGGHLSCFSILAIANTAAVIIGVHASFQISDFFYIPRNRVAGSHDNPIFNFWSNLHGVFHSGCTFTFLPTLYKSSLFFTSSPTFLIYRLKKKKRFIHLFILGCSGSLLLHMGFL